MSTSTPTEPAEKSPVTRLHHLLNSQQLGELKHELLMQNARATITAPLVRHVQRGAQLSLAAACEEFAEQARIMASCATESKPQLSPEYQGARRRLNEITALLDRIGWDESTTQPAEPKRLDAKCGGYHDTSVWLAMYFDTLYDALCRVLEDLDQEGAAGSGWYASLLESRQTLDGWVEGALGSSEERSTMEDARRKERDRVLDHAMVPVDNALNRKRAAAAAAAAERAAAEQAARAAE